MLNTSYFDMLSHHEGRGFEKHFTNALIEGLKDDKDEWEDIGCQIDYAIKTFKEEGKQLYVIADYIKAEVQSEIDLIQDKVLKTDNFMDAQEKKSINRLNDFIGFIQYYYIDYYEAAKQLTKTYKDNLEKQKHITKNKKQLKAA